MKLTVTQENLTKALTAVGRVASGKTPLPILNNILLRTDSNRLVVAATNLEIAITEHIGAKIEQNGAVTVPARLMTEFISNLPKGNVELVADGAHLKITAGRYSSMIHGMEADEFPELPTISEAISFDIPLETFKRAVTQTVLAASGDATRPILTGVYAHTYEGQLYFVASDGYRLAERRIQPVAGELAAIIPASTLQDVLRVAPESSASVSLLFDDTQVRFRMNEVEVTSRLIDGTFLDYRQLIPKTTEHTVELEKADFTRITKIASLFARESGGSVVVKTDSTKQALSMHSIASQLGENTSEAAGKVVGDGEVTLNSRYLLEALNCIDSADVRFAFGGKLAPCVLTAISDDPDYQHIIMPMKS
ncbi:MAG TPA: DNA polymerase III subunit beta [Verrucomicrobiae bacterium]|nr:DNA polymerase III subunit beta [Verrucomicrobiae bacterium]